MCSDLAVSDSPCSKRSPILRQRLPQHRRCRAVYPRHCSRGVPQRFGVRGVHPAGHWPWIELPLQRHCGVQVHPELLDGAEPAIEEVRLIDGRFQAVLIEAMSPRVYSASVRMSMYGVVCMCIQGSSATHYIGRTLLASCEYACNFIHSSLSAQEMARSPNLLQHLCCSNPCPCSVDVDVQTISPLASLRTKSERDSLEHLACWLRLPSDPPNCSSCRSALSALTLSPRHNVRCLLRLRRF